MSSAIDSNFYYKGVGSSASCRRNLNWPNYSYFSERGGSRGYNKFLLIKLYVYSPTAQTRTFPTPSITFDPERIKQESFFVFAIFTGTLEIMSDSPVTEDSSIFSSEPSTKIPSICNKSPIVTVRRSPTKSSLLSRYRVRLIIFMKFFEKF